MTTKGLIELPSGYHFQARIPKKYLPHYSKQIIKEKLPTENRKEAILLVLRRWVELHEEFSRIDSTGTRDKTTLSTEEANHIIQQAIHSRLFADDEIRSAGVDDHTFMRLEQYHTEADTDEKLAIARGALSPQAVSIVSDWLCGYGFNLDPSSTAFREFALRFLKEQTKATSAMKLRQQGVPMETPAAPSELPKAQPGISSTESTITTLEKLMDYWLTQPAKASGIPKGRTARNEAEYVIKKLREYAGDLKPHEVTEDHVVLLKDKMLEAGLSNATINKSRSILAAMFSTAKKNRKLSLNPCADMEKLSTPRGEVDKPYTIQELQTIFNSGVYTKGYRHPRFNGEAYFWIPLIALYTGARLNEVGQLFTEDIGEEDGITFITIKPDIKTGRTNKTNSKRRAPIHPDLIRMGFMHYVDLMKTQGHQQLFPELKITRVKGKLADKWGSYWSAYVRKELKITRIPQPSHGFRHAFIEHGRRSNMNNELRRLIEGHVASSVDMKSYGSSNYPIEPLYAEIVKLTFKGLDLSHLYKD